jgi:Helix-turn-helix domain
VLVTWPPLQKVGQKAPGLEPGEEWPHLLVSTHALYYTKAMRKTFKYRLYPNNEQRRLLEQQLDECRWLYNRLLEERKTAWDQRQQSVRLYDQHAMLSALKAERPALAGVQSQVLQTVAVRLDLAFQAFFRRLKAGETPGSPVSEAWAATTASPSPRCR